MIKLKNIITAFVIGIFLIITVQSALAVSRCSQHGYECVDVCDPDRGDQDKGYSCSSIGGSPIFKKSMEFAMQAPEQQNINIDNSMNQVPEPERGTISAYEPVGSVYGDNMDSICCDVNYEPAIDLPGQLMRENSGPRGPLDLNDYSSDPDEDELTYSVISQENAVCEIIGNELTFYPDPGFTGLAFCTIEANDGFLIATDDLIIEVTELEKPPGYDDPFDISEIVDTQETEVTGDAQLYNIDLVEGWNLISLPLKPTDGSLETILANIEGKFESAWTLDRTQGWLFYDAFYHDNDNLVLMDEKHAYWINLNVTDATLEYTGNEISNTHIMNYNGKNEISYSSINTQDYNTVYNLVEESITEILEYDNQEWSTPTSIIPGKGYKIQSIDDIDWKYDLESNYHLMHAYNGTPTGTIYTPTPTLTIQSTTPATCKGNLNEDLPYDQMTITFEGEGTQTHQHQIQENLENGTTTVFVKCKVNEIPDTISYDWSFDVDLALPEITYMWPENITAHKETINISAIVNYSTNVDECSFYAGPWDLGSATNNSQEPTKTYYTTWDTLEQLYNYTVWVSFWANCTDTQTGYTATRVHGLEIDNQPPAPITDFRGITIGEPRRLDIYWTAPGDEWNRGTLQGHYTLKYSEQEITEENFDQATTYPGSEEWNPAGNGTGEGKTLFLPEEQTWYYLALKATDNVGHETPIALIHEQSGWNMIHDISVDSITCYKGDKLCNDPETTIYLYDNLTIKTNITNNGNTAETFNVRLREEPYGGTVIIKEVTIPAETTQEVIWHHAVSNAALYVQYFVITDEIPFDVNPFDNYLPMDYYFSVWSVQEEFNLEWIDEQNYPCTTQGCLAEEPTYIYGTIGRNSAQPLYLDHLSFELSINNTFEVVQVMFPWGSAEYSCTNDLKQCNVSNIPTGDDHQFIWQISPITTPGLHNVSVTIGQHMEDLEILTRMVDN